MSVPVYILNHESGVAQIGVRYHVIPECVDAARETVQTLRNNASEADQQATECGSFRSKVLLRIAREARSLADDLENQCDRIEGVK